jgi:VWFA-related protein
LVAILVISSQSTGLGQPHHSTKKGVAGSAFGAVSPVLLAGQQPQDQAPVFRVETPLVLIRFQVLRGGRLVGDIREEQIRIVEDGVPKPLALFEGPQAGRRNFPIVMILLLDVSQSVMNIGLLNGAVLKETVFGGLDESASIGIYAFQRRTRQFCSPTRDIRLLEEGLRHAYDFEGLGSMIYESIIQVSREVARQNPGSVRAMIVFSDGFETGKAVAKDAVAAASQSDFKLFPVVLGHSRLAERIQRARPEARYQAEWQEKRMAEFAEIGELTGGRSFDPQLISPAVVREILRIVALETSNEYVTGYFADSSEGPPRKRSARVILADKSLGKLRGGRKDYTR